jgi:hypothetical protein
MNVEDHGRKGKHPVPRKEFDRLMGLIREQVRHYRQEALEDNSVPGDDRGKIWRGRQREWGSVKKRLNVSRGATGLGHRRPFGVRTFATVGKIISRGSSCPVFVEHLSPPATKLGD